MAKVQSEKQYNSFVKGIITEASPLTYPENASLDEDNFVLNRDGSRSRRLGIDYETNYALIPTGLVANILQETKQSFHKWPFPGGSSTTSLGIIRIYNKLWFVDMLKTNPSANLKNGGNPITISGLENEDMETAVINNFCIVVSKDLDSPVLLSYNPTTDSVAQETLSIKVRDLWGIDDNLAIDTRPNTLSSAHKYNLRNQGWSTKITTTSTTTIAEAAIVAAETAADNTSVSLGLVDTDGDLVAAAVRAALTSLAVSSDAIQQTFNVLGVYPSNADLWSLGKVGDASSANYEKYDPTRLTINSIDNGLVSRGSYIIDAFNRGTDRTTLSGISLPLDKENGRLTTIASYAGRVFYSGITSNITDGDDNSPNYAGYIFFSQIAKAKESLGKCYQEADPTSPDISDIIDTDGGTIHIPEASQIYKIIATKGSLLVFADNGVWEVFGDTGGFIATSYQLSKVSSVGISNPKAVVDANGVVIYWAKAGIYILTQDPASGRYIAQSLSLTTIQTLYNNLSDLTKNNARGFFDEKQNRVRWLYNDSGSYSNTGYINKYNKELILDLTLQAFYPASIAITTGLPFVTDYVEIPGYTTANMQELVYVGNDVVQVGGVDVDITTTVQVARVSPFSFLTMSGTSFTLSKYIDTTFMDWKTSDGVGVNYLSFLLTGYELVGDLMRMKQVPHIFFFFSRTEDGFSTVGSDLVLDNQSSCLVQAQWNWANSAAGGKWGTAFQTYKLNRPYIPTGAADPFDYGERVIVTKNKLRGSGRALSLLISSEQGKDMKLLGWSLPISGDSQA